MAAILNIFKEHCDSDDLLLLKTNNTNWKLIKTAQSYVFSFLYILLIKKNGSVI